MTSDLEQDDALQASINVTPLVDVLLVLLVIFMVVTPMLRQNLPVDLPRVAHDGEPPPPGEVTLTVTADGRLLLDGTPIEESRLADAVAHQPVVFLEADRTLPYARVVDLMDTCRAAGVERIGVVTRVANPAS
jgi:biopolymer transport protein ExbD